MSRKSLDISGKIDTQTIRMNVAGFEETLALLRSLIKGIQENRASPDIDG